MLKSGVDHRHASEHLQYHRDFEQAIQNQFANTTGSCDGQNLIEFVEYLIRWLAYHILHTDKSLVRQLEAIKSDGKSPEEAYLNESKLDASATEPLLMALNVLYLMVSKKN